RTLQTLLGVVLGLAAEAPVMLVVEDLHWIDPTTMELLTLLINQIPTVAFKPGEPPARVLIHSMSALNFCASKPANWRITCAACPSWDGTGPIGGPASLSPNRAWIAVRSDAIFSWSVGVSPDGRVYTMSAAVMSR